MASRIESSTKAFGTDLLVSEAINKSVGDKFVIEFAGAAEVKGKSEALNMYRVRGYINENGEKILIRTPWSDYEAGDAEKVKLVS